MRPTKNRNGTSRNHLQNRLYRSMQVRADFVPERSPAEIDQELARITTVTQADEGMRRRQPALAVLPAFLSIACAIIFLAGCVTLIVFGFSPTSVAAVALSAMALPRLLGDKSRV